MLALALSPACSAASIFFTTQSEFEAQSGPVTQVTFAGIAMPGGFEAVGPTLTQDGLTFSTTNDSLFVIDSTFAGPDGPWSLFGQPVLNDFTISNLQVQLPSGTTAAGMQIALVGLLPDVSEPATITLSTGETFTFNLSETVPGFIGFVSTTPVTSFTVTTAGGGGLETPMVEYAGAPSQVPEPTQTGLVLLSAGFGLFAHRRRLFHRN